MVSFRHCTYTDCQSGLLDELPFLPAGDLFSYVGGMVVCTCMVTCSADIEDTCTYHTYLHRPKACLVALKRCCTVSGIHHGARTRPKQDR